MLDFIKYGKDQNGMADPEEEKASDPVVEQEKEEVFPDKKEREIDKTGVSVKEGDIGDISYYNDIVYPDDNEEDEGRERTGSERAGLSGKILDWLSGNWIKTVAMIISVSVLGIIFLGVLGRTPQSDIEISGLMEQLATTGKEMVVLREENSKLSEENKAVLAEKETIKNSLDEMGSSLKRSEKNAGLLSENEIALRKEIAVGDEKLAGLESELLALRSKTSGLEISLKEARKNLEANKSRGDASVSQTVGSTDTGAKDKAKKGMLKQAAKHRKADDLYEELSTFREFFKVETEGK